MLQPMSDNEVKNLVNNFRLMFKTKDITRMSRGAYNFLTFLGGFIAHYNQRGFIEHYGDVYVLAEDIIFNKRNAMTNYTPGEKDYEYYKQKAAIYQQVLDLVLSYIPDLEDLMHH